MTPHSEKVRLPPVLHNVQPLLAITFIGGGSGESIVFNVGGRLVGVIDSCSITSETRMRYETVSVLKKILAKSGSPIFACLVLTHPHLDHFIGMDQLLGRYAADIIRVCLFQGVTERELAELYHREAKEPYMGRSCYKFYKHYGLLLDAYKRLLSPNQRLRVGDRSELINEMVITPSGERIPFRLTCLSPSEDDCRVFLSQVRFKNFMRVAAQVGGRLAQACNRVSVVNRLEFGETRVILGADAEAESWTQIAGKYRKDELECNLLKVSHHGSKTGARGDVLRTLVKSPGTGQDRVAVIAPSTLHGLPHDDTVRDLETHFDRVMMTVDGPGEVPSIDRIRLHFPGADVARGLPRWNACYRTIVFDHCGRWIHDRLPTWV